MHYTRDLQTYTAASGFPWTVVSGLAIPEAMAKRRLYAWVGLGWQTSNVFNASYEIVLKSGAVEATAVEVATIPQKAMLQSGRAPGVTGWWDNFCAQDAIGKNSLAPARTGGNLLRLDFNFAGIGGTDYAAAVDLAPIECGLIKANWAQLRITAMSYPNIGASSATLVCFLGVYSEAVK